MSDSPTLPPSKRYPVLALASQRPAGHSAPVQMADVDFSEGGAVHSGWGDLGRAADAAFSQQTSAMDAAARLDAALNVTSIDQLSPEAMQSLFNDYLTLNQDRTCPELPSLATMTEDAFYAMFGLDSGTLAPMSDTDFHGTCSMENSPGLYSPAISPFSLQPATEPSPFLAPGGDLPELDPEQTDLLVQLVEMGNEQLASSLAASVMSPPRSKNRTRSKKAASDNRPPRPLNSFMTYRVARQGDVIRLFPRIDNRDISRVVAIWWKQEPEEVKNVWRFRAEEGKRLHEMMYPDYRYRPKRKMTSPAGPKPTISTNNTPKMRAIRGNGGARARVNGIPNNAEGAADAGSINPSPALTVQFPGWTAYPTESQADPFARVNHPHSAPLRVTKDMSANALQNWYDSIPSVDAVLSSPQALYLATHGLYNEFPTNDDFSPDWGVMQDTAVTSPFSMLPPPVDASNMATGGFDEKSLEELLRMMQPQPSSSSYEDAYSMNWAPSSQDSQLHTGSPGAINARRRDPFLSPALHPAQVREAFYENGRFSTTWLDD